MILWQNVAQEEGRGGSNVSTDYSLCPQKFFSSVPSALESKMLNEIRNMSAIISICPNYTIKSVRLDTNQLSCF